MDTTGTTAGFIFYGLAKNPKVLEKLMIEVNSINNL
jgi:cytochrome P450